MHARDRRAGRRTAAPRRRPPRDERLHALARPAERSGPTSVSGRRGSPSRSRCARRPRRPRSAARPPTARRRAARPRRGAARRARTRPTARRVTARSSGAPSSTSIVPFARARAGVDDAVGERAQVLVGRRRARSARAARPPRSKARAHAGRPRRESTTALPASSAAPVSSTGSAHGEAAPPRIADHARAAPETSSARRPARRGAGCGRAGGRAARAGRRRRARAGPPTDGSSSASTPRCAAGRRASASTPARSSSSSRIACAVRRR